MLKLLVVIPSWIHVVPKPFVPFMTVVNCPIKSWEHVVSSLKVSMAHKYVQITVSHRQWPMTPYVCFTRKDAVLRLVVDQAPVQLNRVNPYLHCMRIHTGKKVIPRIMEHFRVT
jgi:hypothetical protein